jgi:hypothetical protein
MREYPGQYLFILAKWQKVLVGCQVVRSVTREGQELVDLGNSG